MQESRNLFQSPLIVDDIHAQATLIREVVTRVEPQIAAVITDDLARRTAKVYLTGCGDSHYVGLAARLAFDTYARVPTEPVESLEFARYIVDAMPANSIVVGVSNSGEVSRTVETLQVARRRKAYTIAITGTPNNRLAQAGEATIIQTVPSLGEDWNPFSVGALGLGNYLASLITLYLIAFRLGELRGVISATEVNALKGQIMRAAEIVERTVAANDAAVQEYARQVSHLDTFQILGAGPSYAVALFSAAKLFEQPHANGVPQELEEWAHEQYFLTRPGATQIFVIVPPGRSRDRALEQMRGARDMGATVVAVCDESDAEVRAATDLAFPIHGSLPEAFSPLTYIVPNQLFATHLHTVRGRPPLDAPYDVNRLREVNYRQIFQSSIPDGEG